MGYQKYFKTGTRFNMDEGTSENHSELELYEEICCSEIGNKQSSLGRREKAGGRNQGLE